jgi:hypothetical protein
MHKAKLCAFKAKKRKRVYSLPLLALNGGGAGIRTRVHGTYPTSIYMLSLPLSFPGRPGKRDRPGSNLLRSDPEAEDKTPGVSA